MDRDWYRERQKRVMDDHYYDPKVFRESREAWALHPSITRPLRCVEPASMPVWLRVVVYLALSALSLPPLMMIFLAINGWGYLESLTSVFRPDFYLAAFVVWPNVIFCALALAMVGWLPFVLRDSARRGFFRWLLYSFLTLLVVVFIWAIRSKDVNFKEGWLL